MKLSQAKKLKKGDKLTVLHTCQNAGERHFDRDSGYWAGDEVIFYQITPKVMVTGHSPTHDKLKVMLFCHTLHGKCAWLNVCNVVKSVDKSKNI